MKRSGFRRLSYEEALAKKRAKAAEHKTIRPKEPRIVKYPTMFGIKARRYTGIKGVLWAIFSDYIRKRDFLAYGGRCVSCNHVSEHWRDADPGHYISVTSGNSATMWDERNVNLQCKRCNNPYWTPDAAIPYAIELDRRWGEGSAEKLRKLSKMYAGSYSEREYIKQIEIYKEKFATLGS